MKKIYTLILLFCSAQASQAQSAGNAVSNFEPPESQYFFNQYLANPAMAGLDSGIHINASYRRPWDAIPGAPITQTFTADANLKNRVGAGLNIFNDKSGLLQRTKVGLTYAYHLPLGMRAQALHFGLSLALDIQRLDTKSVNGETNDPSIGRFNRRDNYFESDFGVAYTDLHLTVQAALPNLISTFKNDNRGVSGLATYYTAASYKFYTGTEISKVEPKIAYRGINGADNIIDAGVNIGLLDDWANVSGMYHSSGSVSAGAGLNYQSLFSLQVIYITQTTGYSTIMGNSFEINLRVNIAK
ncbi:MULTISPECIES: PorP/SprF family type IX secretion system membrane protein [unclassified Chitinophaga]|uniref:PorP/SprF family type IX secretion system membrane protein n=1 Tax=unclassified Chitinophaga TaxID=2619133 RepID=UPI0009D06C48|nr:MULTISPECIES: PorP/SprF family type IX secretion system membrane protein [unclassified Chitinophaga]OMP79103.1 hypothetical protein BW716_10795 [[Flexibacter] sp. ATCC 35208]WPV68087.1 PorP/SprF family type IX secretion system membrane protein [Chitinophaga sp. LS1]